LDRMHPLPNSPLVIVISMHADEHLWAEALNLGAHDVLAKPLDAREVERVLQWAWVRWGARHDRKTVAPQTRAAV
jgi:FixJ family two-component response regulator